MTNATHAAAAVNVPAAAVEAAAALLAAEAAWCWAASNPTSDEVYNRALQAYHDAEDALWAAAEYERTTRAAALAEAERLMG